MCAKKWEKNLLWPGFEPATLGMFSRDSPTEILSHSYERHEILKIYKIYKTDSGHVLQSCCNPINFFHSFNAILALFCIKNGQFKMVHTHSKVSIIRPGCSKLLEFEKKNSIGCLISRTGREKETVTM